MLEVFLQVLGAVVLTTMLVIAGGIYLFFSTTTPVEGSPTRRHPPTTSDTAGRGMVDGVGLSEGGVVEDGGSGEGLEAALHDIAAAIVPAMVHAVVGMMHPKPNTTKCLGTSRLCPTGTAAFSHSPASQGGGGGQIVCELDESARWLERVIHWATIALGCSMSSVHEKEDSGIRPSVGELVQALCDRAVDGASLKLREKFKSDALCLSLRKLRLGEVRCEIDSLVVAAPKAPSLGGRHIQTQFCVDVAASKGVKLGQFIRLPCASQPMYITIPFNWSDSDAYLRLSAIFPLLLNNKVNDRFSLAADFVTLTAAAAVSGIDLDGDVCVRLCLGLGPGEDQPTNGGDEGATTSTTANYSSEILRPIVSMDFTFLKAPTLLMALQVGLGDELVENPIEVAVAGSSSVGGVEAPTLSQLSTSATGSQHRLKAVPPPRGAQPAVGTARITRIARLHVSQALEKLTFPNVTRITVSLREDGKRAISTRRIKVPTGSSW